eukprot:TRINITY_DN53405_c0_g1_i1.p1 TRINITY_DN53405_c0_g1~~TRINITY_DN53405_c0_g1_i1.p1  ORF type:complete len:473 (-),score=159.30 TRINITY_DN53405_c0_g1_i1:33-1451(-)
MISRWLTSCLLIHLSHTVRYDAVKQQTGYFWHIDSASLNLDYSISGDRNKNCQERSSLSNINSYRLPLGEFGDSACDSPLQLVKSATEFIKKVRGEDFDFILWTGDSSPSSAMGEDNSTRYLQEMTLLLREQFPYSSIYPVLGDMDFNPRGQAQAKADPMYKVASDLWGTWLPPKAIDSLKHGGYYKIDLAGRKLQLVALNTALYLSTNEQTRHSYHHDPGNQWHWLENILEKARLKHQTVIIFGHTPPGVFERDWTNSGRAWLQQTQNIRYLRLILQYSDVIVGQFFGHQNTDTFRVFYNNKRQAVSWALISPGISPRTVVEGMREPVISSPSMRLYKYSVYDGKVLDYSQFSLSLSQSNTEGRPVWDLQYNFSSLYGAESISPASLDRVYNTMATQSSPLLDNYLLANTAGMDHPKDCRDTCRKVHLCAIPNVDITNFRKCISQANMAVRVGREWWGVKVMLVMVVFCMY